MKHLEVDLVKDAQDKVRSIKSKLLEAKSRKKKFVNHKLRDKLFNIGKNILLKVLPMKGLARRVVTVLDKFVQCRFLTV